MEVFSIFCIVCLVTEDQFYIHTIQQFGTGSVIDRWCVLDEIAHTFC